MWGLVFFATAGACVGAVTWFVHLKQVSDRKRLRTALKALKEEHSALARYSLFGDDAFDRNFEEWLQ